MVHFNARSISANLDTLFSNLMMLKHKFSIIAVTETWTDSNSEQAINIPGYNKIIKSRDVNVASRGGGVALFFSSDLAVDVKRRPDISCPTDVMECIFVQISHKQISTKDVIVGVVYRRPGTNISVFNEHFGAMLAKINGENRPSHILGDFNIDLLNSRECNQTFLNTLLSNSFYPSISRPTRIKDDRCATLIDNIFINTHNNQTTSGIWLADITDHLPVFVTLPYEYKPIAKNDVSYIHKRHYSDENINNFRMKLSGSDWTPIYMAEGVDKIFNVFNNFIIKTHNECFPLITTKVNTRNLFKPWLTSSILNSIRKKNNMYKNYLKSRSPTLKNKYLKYKNRLVTVIREAEKLFYANKLNEVRDNLSKTWRVMNEMCGRNSQQKPITKIRVNDETIDDP